MKRMLVTGGAGFLGSHIADELIRRGHEVRVLDNFFGKPKKRADIPEGVEVIDGDVASPETCRQAVADVDVIFHIAAHAAEGQSVFIPVFNATTNIIGSLNLLVAAMNAGIRDIVFTSSIAAYGRPLELPIRESHPLNPEDPYGITKKTVEDYLRVYHELDQIDPYIVRFFNVFGPRQRMNDPYRGVVPIFINKGLKGEAPVIFGDGSQKRAFTYVSDIVQPICDMVGRKKLINNPINIGSTEVWSVKQLAEAILEKMGLNLAPQFVSRRTTDVHTAFCDMAKAKELFGYEAQIPIAEGLDKTIAWARTQGPQEFAYMDHVEIGRLAHGVYKKKSL